MTSLRSTEYPINPLFIERWSPRAFSGEAIDDTTLLSLFEAARWAPSSFNSQPWRFIYAKNDSPEWQGFLALLSEFNQSWAKNASVLIVVIAKTTFTPPGKDQAIAMASHAFDTGAAWGYLALQAALSGWAAHGIGGFDKDKTRSVLSIPEDYSVEAVIAVGRQTDKSVLSEGLQAKETPSLRQPIRAFAVEARFSFAE